MPELPEVETTRRGIEPLLKNQQVSNVIVRQKKLRWPIPAGLKQLIGQHINQVERRAKYLFLRSETGTVIVHLGMSGSLRVLPSNTPVQKHDHVDIQLHNGQCLRYRDPRRFGAVLWTKSDPLTHKLLINLGPEPLGNYFSGRHLFEASRKRKVLIKPLIMNSQIVVGVGNIYASEALFMAGIHPKRIAGRITEARYQKLAEAIRDVLQKAIRLGGTTLKDFSDVDGEPGYFANELLVYGRAGQQCINCNKLIKQEVIAQRSSFFCGTCQK